MNSDLGIVIAAGGSGSRYGRNKLFEPLNGLPLFIHCLKTFIPLAPVGQLILVVADSERQRYSNLLEKFLPEVEIRLAAGGRYRAESVLNGLRHLPDQVEYVAIHDAARPFASADLLSRCLAVARQYGGAIPARPVTDTLKQVNQDDFVVTTVKRDELWRVETPQLFNRKRLNTAYRLLAEKFPERLTEATDETVVMELAGFAVKIVRHHERNLKITYPGDIAVAEGIIKAHQLLEKIT